MGTKAGCRRRRISTAFPVVLLAVLVAALAAGCGESENWPTATCSPDLAIGTACIPAEGHYGAELFAGVTDPDEAREKMEIGTAGLVSANCTTQPDTWTVCVSNFENIFAVNPIDIPEGTKVRFIGSELDEVEPISLRAGEAIGVRRDNGVLRVLFADGDDELGEINLGFYG